MNSTQALPGQARHEPAKLLGREGHRASVILRPGKTAALQTPRAQPHSRSVVDQHLQPVSTPVGKYVCMVGLSAQGKTAYHLGQQRINANA